MREIRPYGSVRGAPSNGCPYRDPTPEQQQDYAQTAWREVGLDRFQFLFDQHALSLHGEPYPDSTHYWAGIVAFLNSPQFLWFARDLTGMADIAFTDAQATRYRAGHFLPAHDDNTSGTNRLAAYVLSFTSAWRPKWGGLLEFLDDASQVEAGFVPSFNALKLFRVPMTHYVSIVAPYATVGRYWITGWLRAR